MYTLARKRSKMGVMRGRISSKTTLKLLKGIPLVAKWLQNEGLIECSVIEYREVESNNVSIGY